MDIWVMIKIHCLGRKKTGEGGCRFQEEGSFGWVFLRLQGTRLMALTPIHSPPLEVTLQNILSA